MNKTPKNALDADILQCKADILRARNTIPQEPEYSEAQNSTTDTTSEEILINEISTPPTSAVSRKKETGISNETPEIPSFDLAEEIMAEQRKITAIRRKAPGKNKVERLKPKVQPADHTSEQPIESLSEQDKVIAEIVARDIEKLCQG